MGQYFKLNAVPTTWVADSIYFIDNGDTVTEYVTSVSGVPRMVGGSGAGVSADRDPLPVDANATADITDAGKVILLDGSTSTVDYTVDPETFNKKTLTLFCVDATNRVRVLPATGTVNGSTEIEFGTNDAVSIYSDGTNLYIIS